ncbi:hypothetical protein FHY55_14965 [Oceanicola sp. D3]|uniref:hypothetical protein n=1 Tax=Oceanicola sp. D3 TaxID=2587163 RepID=UPI00112218A0|nr:hypothetical protein [Oceanicola sp. D3]QDC10463.1 hypothetical protein FHY55_14965 [Oceanicola sp. D3]
MGRLSFITLAIALAAAIAIPARASDEDFGKKFWSWLSGTNTPAQVEETSSGRPKVWTLHPSDRARHPEERFRGGGKKGHRLFPFQKDYVVYGGGPSRGLSIGTTTPNGAIIRQGSPSLSRGIKRSSVKRKVRRAFR